MQVKNWSKLHCTVKFGLNRILEYLTPYRLALVGQKDSQVSSKSFQCLQGFKNVLCVPEFCLFVTLKRFHLFSLATLDVLRQPHELEFLQFVVLV